MEEKQKNVLRLEYLPLQDAIELYKQGIFVKGVLPTSSLEQDLAGIDENLKNEFLSYYVSDLQAGTFEYDMSMDDYMFESTGDYNVGAVELDGNSYDISQIYTDELGYNIETDQNNIINYNSNEFFENQEQYNSRKKEVLSKAKDITVNSLKTVGSSLLAPLTRFSTVKANRFKDIDSMVEGGLYHFTSEKAADLILQSGHIRPSGKIASYSMRKKTFLFAAEQQTENGEKGISLDNTTYNLRDHHAVMTAIKVNCNEALKRDIAKGKVQIRLDDGAVCIVGEVNEKYGYDLQKVNMQFVVDKENQRAYYKEMEDRPLTQEEMNESQEYENMFKKYNRIPKFARDLVTYPILARKVVSRFFNGAKELTKALPESKEQNINEYN